MGQNENLRPVDEEDDDDDISTVCMQIRIHIRPKKGKRKKRWDKDILGMRTGMRQKMAQNFYS